jgi:hypothetical protein
MKLFTAKRQLISLLGVSLLMWSAAHAQLTPSQDAYTNTADPTTNYGVSKLLNVESSQTTYIQFDLSAIPAGYTGSNITKASLKLYVNTVPKGGNFNVDYVNGTWMESTITASLAPALGTTIQASVPLTTADKNQYIIVDITAAVQAWLNGTANDGIALVGNSPVDATFDSKESTTTSHPPELDIVFAGGSSGITGITTAAGSGLIGGGTSGTLNLSLTNTCAKNQMLQWTGTAWGCASAGTGTITGVTAGTDLTGGGSSGNVTLNLDTTKVPLLNVANTFVGNQAITGNLTATGSISAQTASLTESGTATALTITQTGGGAGLTVSAPTSLAAIQSIAANIGVWGIATNASATGVEGEATSGYGVLGVDNASSGVSVGVAGVSDSSAGYGVQGTSSNVGVYGSGTGTAGYGVDGHGTLMGVKGVGTGTSGTSIGVYGQTADTTGYGVEGASSNVGVYGAADGSSTTSEGFGGFAGIWGDTGGEADSRFYVGILGTADDNFAGYFVNDTGSDATNPTLELVNLTTTPGALLLATESGTDDICTIDAGADLTCSGTIKGVVQVEKGARKVSLYAMQSAENWFEDAGSGHLSNGSASIALDPTFAQTVNLGVEYHVFLTPNGDCKGLYVSQKSATSFEVHELGGGTSSVGFDYRIMAKRSGYENARLADVTEQYRKIAQQHRLRQQRMQQHRAAQSAEKPVAAVPTAPRKQTVGAVTHNVPASR